MADARHPVSSMYTVVRVRLRRETKKYPNASRRFFAAERIKINQLQIPQYSLAVFSSIFVLFRRKSERAYFYFDRWRAFYSRAALNAFSFLPAVPRDYVLESRMSAIARRRARKKTPSAKFTLLPPRPFR